jgi:hypothetical protein
MKTRWMMRALSAVLSFLMVSSLVAPQLLAQSRYRYGDTPDRRVMNDRYRDDGWRDWDRRGQESSGEEPGRTVGGSIGMAAGMVGGAALASAVIGAAGIAAWGPAAVMLIGSAITIGGAFAGAKLFSSMGGKFTKALGRDNMWMMIGAVLGTVAAIALITTTGGIFAGAGGLLIKAMIGGIAGGVIGKLFAPQLEALATPRNLMMGMGALVGGLGGGIPGAIAGAVGGYALGAIMDDNFFTQPGDRLGNYLPFGGGDKDTASGAMSSIKDAWGRLMDWGSDKKDDTKDWWDRNYNRDDPVYRRSYDLARGNDRYSPWDYDYQTSGRYQDQSWSWSRGSRDSYNSSYRDALRGAESGRMSREQFERYRDQDRRRLSGY